MPQEWIRECGINSHWEHVAKNEWMELGAKNEIQYKEILEKDKGTMKWEIKLSKKTKAEKDQV